MKLAASSVLSQSLAGLRSRIGHPLCLHGSDRQHPKKVVSSSLHEYHLAVLSAQAYSEILSYKDALKLAGRRYVSGHTPLKAHGFEVQQPMNCNALPWQV